MWRSWTHALCTNTTRSHRTRHFSQRLYRQHFFQVTVDLNSARLKLSAAAYGGVMVFCFVTKGYSYILTEAPVVKLTFQPHACIDNFSGLENVTNGNKTFKLQGEIERKKIRIVSLKNSSFTPRAFYYLWVSEYLQYCTVCSVVLGCARVWRPFSIRPHFVPLSHRRSPVSNTQQQTLDELPAGCV